MRQPNPNQTYLDALFGREEASQQAIRASAPRHLAGMMLTPHEGALLAWLAQSIQARNILEIGSFVGYSASWLLRILPADGRLHCIESDAGHAALFADNLAHPLDTNRLVLHTGSAGDILPLLSPLGPFDFIFIDADKRATPEYLAWAERHLRPGGMVAVDNTLSFGSVRVAADTAPSQPSPKAGWQAMREVNAYLAESARWHAMLLPTPGGLTVGIKA